jgi:hypothetical protein
LRSFAISLLFPFFVSYRFDPYLVWTNQIHLSNLDISNSLIVDDTFIRNTLRDIFLTIRLCVLYVITCECEDNDYYLEGYEEFIDTSTLCRVQKDLLCPFWQRAGTNLLTNFKILIILHNTVYIQYLFISINTKYKILFKEKQNSFHY